MPLDTNVRSYLDGETWPSPSRDVAVEAGCTLISAINLNLSVKAEVKAEGRPAGGGRWGGVIAPLLLHYGVIPLLKRKIKISSKLPEANSPLYLSDRLRVGGYGEIPS